MSERSLEINKPSTSSTITHQPKGKTVPFRAKSKDKATRVSPKHSSGHGHKPPHQTNAITVDTVESITNECQNLTISTPNDVQEECDKVTTCKRKNSKKKQRQLSTMQTPQPSGFAPPLLQQDRNIGQQMLVMPMYQMCPPQNVNTMYFENMSYHPNYQYLQTPQGLINLQSIQNIQDQNGARYLQNVMQHPLLSRFNGPVSQNPTIYQNNMFTHNRQGQYQHQQNLHQTQKRTKRSPKPERKKEKKEDPKFEPYVTYEEVELGLEQKTLVQGVLRINPKVYQHAYMSSDNRSEQDIFLDGLFTRNRALEGDIVVVQLLQDKELTERKQKHGKVVYIREKVHTRTCIGTLKLMPDKNGKMAYFAPRDYRVPRLNIPCTSWPNNFFKDPKAYENTLFLAKIIDWSDTRFALGLIEQQIGESGDLAAERRAILAQNDLDITPFDPEMQNLYPRADYTIPPEEIQKREDLRKLCIFSIDPYNCRDIDDAVSCRELENGNYEIGVHISDVTHHLTEGTKLDEKVAQRATTIYMVDKAYHMLPDDLCYLCSLFPDLDKLAFSVIWEITKDAEVISHRLTKSVIHSCCKLSYEHAQGILDDSIDVKDFPEIYNDFKFDDVCKTIKALGNIAAILRKNRFEGGSLRIDQPKVYFTLNPSGLPESISVYQSTLSHQLIEEFMLLANITVANRIYEDHPSLAFLRCHPVPSKFMFQELVASLAPMGIDIDITTAGGIHKSLAPFFDTTDKAKAIVLSQLCAKPMQRAKYFCAGCQSRENFCHYALNVPLYTHFTSPIRRYADIVVHR